MVKRVLRIAGLVSGLGVLLMGLVSCQTQVPHTVSTPDTPSGPSTGQVGEILSFTTGGASCSQGHPLEYRFDWGDGTYSSWSSTPTASHSWTAAGTYQVKAQARCSLDRSVVSSWSSGKSVTIAAASKLQILNYQLLPYDNPFMPWVIRGYAKNVSGKTLRYAEVRGQFYDANNVLLCTWLDNVTDLAPDIVWEFNIYCICTDVCNRVHHATVTVGFCW
jgi:hypothetical protein